MRAALLIAGKDVRQRLRDRSALLVAIVMPLVLASIFGLIFHDVAGGSLTFDFGVVAGGESQRFEERALRPLERRGLLVVHREPTLAAGRDAADQGKVAATFAFRAGRVDVIGDIDQPIGAQVAQSIAETYAAGGASARAIEDVSARSRQLDVGTFYAAGMAVFFLFFTVQLGVSSILDERREGTLARMLVAPIRRGSVLVGKLLTSLVLGVLSMVVLAVTTHVVLDAHWGGALGVLALIVAGVLAATAVMALVATLARTADQAQAWQSMVALVLGMLGGTFFPVAQAGGLLAGLSLATPQAWFLRGVEDLSAGEGTGAVVAPVAAMLAFAAVTGGLALTRAGRLVER